MKLLFITNDAALCILYSSELHIILCYAKLCSLYCYGKFKVTEISVQRTRVATVSIFAIKVYQFETAVKVVNRWSSKTESAHGCKSASVFKLPTRRLSVQLLVVVTQKLFPLSVLYIYYTRLINDRKIKIVIRVLIFIGSSNLHSHQTVKCLPTFVSLHFLLRGFPLYSQ